MKTQTNEEISLNEIRRIPTPVLPQVNAVTGFCGVWQDERPADEIIADIATHRSGFGGRRVQL